MVEPSGDLADVKVPTLRRLDHPWRAIIALGLLSAALIGAFLIGRVAEAPSRDAILAAQESIPVSAPVERRVVDPRTSFAASIRAGEDIDLLANAVATPAVVVRRTLSVGDPLPYGTLLGIVSGQPFFSLPTPLPTYRDLHPGDRGDDVTAFQNALKLAGGNLKVTGVVDWGTFVAVRNLFEDYDFELAWGEPIPYRQFLGIPGEAGVVTAAAEAGTRLDDATPLVSIRIAPPYVSLRADAIASDDLTVGDTMTIRAEDTTFNGTVSSIGPFSEGTDGGGPGRDIAITSKDPAFVALRIGSPVTVLSSDGDLTGKNLAIPVTALREDADGHFIEREITEDGEQSFERVSVTVLFSGGGWVAVSDGGELQVGDEIRVS